MVLKGQESDWSFRDHHGNTSQPSVYNLGLPVISHLYQELTSKSYRLTHERARTHIICAVMHTYTLTNTLAHAHEHRGGFVCARVVVWVCAPARVCVQFRLYNKCIFHQIV